MRPGPLWLDEPSKGLWGPGRSPISFCSFIVRIQAYIKGMKHRMEEVSLSLSSFLLSLFACLLHCMLSCCGVLWFHLSALSIPGQRWSAPLLASEEIADWFLLVSVLAFVQSALSKGGSLCPAAGLITSSENGILQGLGDGHVPIWEGKLVPKSPVRHLGR